MPNIPITQLGSTGLITDIEPSSVPPGGWTSCENVRFRNGNVEKIYGWEDALVAPLVAPYFNMAWENAGSKYWFYANDTGIYRTDGSANSDVTRSAGAYTGNPHPIWIGTIFGGVPVMTHNAVTDPPQAYNSGTGLFEDLANFPTNWTCKSIREFNNQLIAMGLDDGTNAHDYEVLISDVADPGTVPTWDYTDPTTKARLRPLSDDGGIVVDGGKLRDTFYVYKQRSVYALQYTGGILVVSSKPVFDSFGLLSQRCYTKFGSAGSPKHFVISFGDAIVHDGRSYESVADGKVRKYLFQRLSSDNYPYAFVVHNAEYNEIWFCYVSIDATDTLCDEAAIWNYKDNTWSFEQLGGIAFAAHGAVSASGAAGTFDGSAGVSFDADGGIFGEPIYPASRPRVLISATTDSKLLLADQTNAFNGTEFTSYVERVNMPLIGRGARGDYVIDSGAVKFISRLYPKVKAESNVVLAFYLSEQYFPNADPVWRGPFYFTPSTDNAVDCLVSTRIVGLRIADNAKGHWEISGIDADVKVIARY